MIIYHIINLNSVLNVENQLDNISFIYKSVRELNEIQMNWALANAIGYKNENISRDKIYDNAVFIDNIKTTIYYNSSTLFGDLVKMYMINIRFDMSSGKVVTHIKSDSYNKSTDLSKSVAMTVIRNNLSNIVLVPDLVDV